MKRAAALCVLILLLASGSARAQMPHDLIEKRIKACELQRRFAVQAAHMRDIGVPEAKQIELVQDSGSFKGIALRLIADAYKFPELSKERFADADFQACLSKVAADRPLQ